MSRQTGRRHRSRTASSALDGADSWRRTKAGRRSGQNGAATGVVVAAVVALVLGTVFLWPRHGDGSEEAATLASALASGDFTDAPLPTEEIPQVTAEYSRITEAFVEQIGRTPLVRLVEQRSEDGALEATYEWAWVLPGEAGTWSYRTTVLLRSGRDGWSAAVDPESIEPSLDSRERLELRVDRPEPGTVVDRDGQTLLGPLDVRVLGIDKPSIKQSEYDASARRLAEVLDIDQDAYAASVATYGPSAFVPALTVRESAIGEYDLTDAGKIPGYREVKERHILPIEKGYAPGVLGTLREATAEEIEESDGEISPGQLVGTAGVTRARAPELIGTPGIRVVAVAGDGGRERGLHTLEVVHGTEVTATLDDDLQRHATELIAGRDSPSAVIVMRPSTGDLLASALGPTGQGYPVGLVGRYAPGSTFKTVTALSLLRAGVSPTTTLECPARATVTGRSFKNADSLDPSLFGTMPLEDVMAHSCNTALLLQHNQVPQSSLADSASALGMMQETPPGLEGAYFGEVDPADVGTEHAAAMMGQGRVLASPLAMAVVMSSVVRGEAVRPRVLADDDSAPVSPAPAAPLTGREAQQLRGMLRGVVTKGSLDEFLDMPGGEVIGKTGTAEWVNDQGELRLHSWVMVAQDDIVVAVFVEDGSYGSRTAGPIAHAMLEKVNGVA